MISVGFITLGCPKNEADTDAMKAQVASSNYVLAEDVDQADVVVVNTCAFIQDATEESIAEILTLADVWLTDRPNRRLLVAGCMVSRYEGSLESEFPEVSAFIPVVDEHTICSQIERATGAPAYSENSTQKSISRTADAAYAYVKISDGCHRSCAYCTIPTIRGPYVSKPLPEVIREVTDLSHGGVKEIILIGQDITAYGRDFPNDKKLALVDVINAVCEVEGVERIRLMYLQPDGVTPELLETIAAQEKVCHYIEMPLQHCDRDILHAMNRSGRRESFSALLRSIRAILPDATLRTTLIVGFPGESQEQFDELVDFVSEIEFDYVGIFAFSPEEGTSAAELPDQIEPEVQFERLQELRDISDSIGWSKAATRVGEMTQVLVEGRDEEGRVYGRTCFQAPDIDGIVRLNIKEGREVAVGDMVDVRLEESVLYDLEGTVE